MRTGFWVVHGNIERYDVLYTVLGSIDREVFGYQTVVKHTGRPSRQDLTD